MNSVFFTRGLCAAALLLSLAACGGGNSASDAGALGATTLGKQAPAVQKREGATADDASSQPLSWAP
jgi:hypothetical protein